MCTLSRPKTKSSQCAFFPTALKQKVWYAAFTRSKKRFHILFQWQVLFTVSMKMLQKVKQRSMTYGKRKCPFLKQLLILRRWLQKYTSFVLWHLEFPQTFSRICSTFEDFTKIGPSCLFWPGGEGIEVEPQRKDRSSFKVRNNLEVHWTMSQVVFPSNVGDLLGLHGLQLRTVCDTMTKTTAKCAAPLPCEFLK